MRGWPDQLTRVRPRLRASSQQLHLLVSGARFSASRHMGHLNHIWWDHCSFPQGPNLVVARTRSVPEFRDAGARSECDGGCTE